MNKSLSDQEVQELIRIADSGVKEWRGHWYTLGIPIPYYFDLNEQLYAINKLGKSGNSKALEFLTKIYSSEEWRVEGDPSQSDADYGGTRYPNAQGELASKLSSTWANPEARFADGSSGPFQHEPDNQVHLILQNAISQLEMSLK